MKPNSPLVTYYHSVAPAPFEGWPLRFLTMELDRFDLQMQFMVERGWRSLFMDEWWAIRKGQAPLKGNELCMTFDDGLLDNWVYAFPVVKKYGLKMTLFVCPELIEDNDHVRPNLEDVWSGKCKPEDLVGPGYLSWGELRAMQRSGHADIQSHTMTHTKHIISDELRGVHYGGFEGYYPALNTYSLETKVGHSTDPGFDKRITIGTPLFEENSAVAAWRRTVDEDFMREAATLSSEHDLSRSEERTAYETRLRDLYGRYKKKGPLTRPGETFAEHVERVEYEIIRSKQILEQKMDKPVLFLCWPHGGNSMATHAIAKQAGYVATTVGKMHSQKHAQDRIPRVGTDWPGNERKARMKFDYKMGAHYGRQPYSAFHLLNEWKNNALNKH